jgi:hypothetical protein
MDGERAADPIKRQGAGGRLIEQAAQNAKGPIFQVGPFGKN